MFAEIVFAFFASFTATAWNTRFQRDAVANFDGADFGPDFGDDATGFVAKDHGIFDDELADCAAGPVVDLN